MIENDIVLEKHGTRIVFRYDVGDDEALCYLKEEETPPERYRVDVFVNGERVARYVRDFGKETGMAHANNFVKKIASDPAYRVQYLYSGSWDGIVEWNDPVNPGIRKTIERLNRMSMNKLKFKDFASLKVGGRDGFSTKKEDVLDAMLSPGIVGTVNGVFPGVDEREQSKRWVARGLHVDKAIRKVKTDAEIRENAERARRTPRYS